ncbi:MAG TPA: SPOR domain-containing protein [Casimicrobiaceae bacterium]|nr:SPOR domain-containing protein [Casimicrobiaceae bacterium]
MRIAVVILVLVNVVLFVYARLDSAGQSETSRLSQQVAPERVKLLKPSDVAALSPAKAAALPDVCAEWGPFADADRSRAENDLAPLALGRTLSQRTVPADAQYWVNLGGMQNRAAADRRAAELRAQAISDLSVVDYPRGQFTVSLGVFRTQAAANARAETLAARGVVGTQVEPRAQGGATQEVLIVRDPPQPVVARMKELSGQYAGTDVKVGPCAPTS